MNSSINKSPTDRGNLHPSPLSQRVTSAPQSNPQESPLFQYRKSLNTKPQTDYTSNNAGNAGKDLSQRKERAKRFLLAMYQNGYGYEHLVKEDFDPHLLRGLYQELGLPVSSSPLQAHTSGIGTAAGKHLNERLNVGQPNGPPSCSAAVTAKPVSTPPKVPLYTPTSALAPVKMAVDEPKQNASQAKQPSSQPGARQVSQDTAKAPQQAPSREEYLARLKAARTQKSPALEESRSPVPPASETRKQPPVSVNELTMLLESQKSQATNNKSTTGNDPTVKRQAELARLRSEALKSAKIVSATKNGFDDGSIEKDQLKATLSVPTPTPQLQPSATERPIEPSTQSQRLGNAPFKANVGTQPATSPLSPCFNLDDDSFPTPAFRIPGLFMDTPQIQMPTRQKDLSPQPTAPAISAVPQAQNSSPRGVTSTTDLVKQILPPSQKHTFGRDPAEEIDDECIIEASEDEDEDPRRSAPAKSGVDVQSSPATALTRTPQPVNQKDPGGLQAHERELLEIKKQLQLLEQKKKTKLVSSRGGTPQNVPVPPKTPNDIAPSNSSQNVQMASIVTPELSLDPRQLAQVQSQQALSNPLPAKPLHGAITPTTSRTPASEGEAASANSKRAKIESDIAQYDARFTSSASQLERLKAQMQELEVTMQREREEKRLLVEELESMGIDTVGIPDEALRETRDEAIANKESTPFDGGQGKHHSDTPLLRVSATYCTANTLKAMVRKKI